MTTPRDRALMQLAQAESRADSAATREHIRAAREAVEEIGPTPLAECPVCEQVASKPVIERHDCA